VNWAAIVAFGVALFLGLGLITSFSPVFESWVGYLLGPFGGPTGGIGASSIGILISFVVAGVLYAVLSPVLAPERRRVS
jgi:hypothetical protein